MRPVQCVVVAYGDDRAPLAECLAALEGGALPVTIVDNSSARAVRALAERHGATYVDTGANLGFGAGANVALRRLLAGPPCDVLLVNPDAVVEAEDVRRLAAFLHRPGIGAVAPRLEGQRVEWPFPNPLRGWLEAVGLGAIRARRTFVIGAVLLLRWEALRDVGLFDERFFLYAEEVDWQRRALARGWRSELCDAVVATHLGGATSSDAAHRERLFHAAQEIYIRKWHGAAGWTVHRAAILTGALVRAALLRGQRRRGAARRVLIYARGPQRVAAGK